MRRVLAAVALATGLVVSLTGCVGHQAVSTTPGPGSLGFVKASDGGYVTHGSAAPVLAGPTIQGGRVSTAGDLGKVVVVNFWAAWCGPCRTEGPAFESVYRSTARRGAVFLGVVFEDNATNALSYDRGAGITYPSLMDPTGGVLAQFTRYLTAPSVPDTVVIGRDGRVVAAFSGPVLAQTLQTVVDTELAA